MDRGEPWQLWSTFSSFWQKLSILFLSVAGRFERESIEGTLPNENSRRTGRKLARCDAESRDDGRGKETRREPAEFILSKMLLILARVPFVGTRILPESSVNCGPFKTFTASN